jgi:hypothetical protein
MSGSVLLRDITAVRLAKRGAARQLHMETNAGVHVVMLLLDDGLPRINVSANEVEYAFLAKRGIPAQETTAYVGNSNRGPVVVPLIVR